MPGTGLRLRPEELLVGVPGSVTTLAGWLRQESETESFLRRLGAEAFLRKPTPPADLIHTVGAMLQPIREEPSRERVALAR